MLENVFSWNCVALLLGFLSAYSVHVLLHSKTDEKIALPSAPNSWAVVRTAYCCTSP